MVWLPLKGTAPIIPEMQDWSKMSFTSVELSVNAAMPSIRTESKEIFSELPGSTSPHPLTPLTPPTPQKKGGGGGEGRDLTHRGARSFGEDQWWETDRSRSRVRVISVTDPKVVIVVTFWNLKLKSQFLSLNHPPPAKKNWLFSCKIFFSLPFSDWLLQSIVVFLVVA